MKGLFSKIQAENSQFINFRRAAVAEHTAAILSDETNDLLLLFCIPFSILHEAQCAYAGMNPAAVARGVKLRIVHKYLFAHMICSFNILKLAAVKACCGY